MNYSSTYNERQSVINRLVYLSQLNEPGWDGYDAEPISEEQVEYVSKLMENVETYPFICASTDGVINLQYDYNNGYISDYLEFTINKDLSINGYHRVIKGIIKESKYYNKIIENDMYDLINEWKENIIKLE